jgi:ATP-dependent helicase Lhr and Lhr-like helicase
MTDGWTDADHLRADLLVLDSLEREELPLLSWGLVDGGFSDDELLDRLDAIAESYGDTRSAEGIRDSLHARALLTHLSLPNSMWRSRMAESLRLIVRLRQLFPSHVGNGTWRTAANLVSDYRFITRPRQFPTRDREPGEMIQAAKDAGANEAVLSSLEGLIGASAASTYSGFQVRAVSAILSGARRPETTATLVAAGTGSGKTKAFYVPALSLVASHVEDEPWTKIVAVYPRNELLKDQLKNALIEARALRRDSGVALKLGAYFGPTPRRASDISTRWPSASGGFICPYLSCPVCSGDLLISSASSTSPLVCVSCGGSVGRDELSISRDEMQDRPPDVLLTTTETLNRQISSDYSRHVFGAGQSSNRAPFLLLLDEVHAYSGLHGAQAAHVLRRWRQSIGRPIHVVGLSATIFDGGPFLAGLVGVDSSQVSVVEPYPEEMTQEGHEYLLALRGDPASGTALLSTTIQTAMLTRRVLDDPRAPVSSGAAGSKVFIFTDNLDITNRLLHFLRDAEGQDDRGRPKPTTPGGAPKGSLANLRNHLEPEYAERVGAGQAWDLAREIGHRLVPAERLTLTRTSSQDPGLERQADIVVATASLEVGLDDETVGAVVQHKAPRDAASFIQRRGRAGRARIMRPWTIVVLSDYGRDRLAFQAWDALFDPRLKPAQLPVANRYVLRIQATYALLDWLAERLRTARAHRGYVWQDVAGPSRGSAARRRLVEGELRRLIASQAARDELRDYISDALAISRDQAERLLWDPPRAVLASAVPTLLRRLESGWQRRAGGVGEDMLAATPLPDFLPSALFQDLLLPEVQIVPPAGSHRADEEAMGVQQALREFAPGRVTHRFAIGARGERMWIPPGEDAGGGPIDVRDVAATVPLAQLPTESGMLRVLRPWSFRTSSPPESVGSSSNGLPVWRSWRAGVGRTIERRVPSPSDWAGLMSQLGFSMHRAGGRIVVHRAITGSEATVNQGGTARSLTTHFVDGDEPVALGFRLDVDGLVLDVHDPNDWAHVLGRDDVRRRGLVVDWFSHQLTTHPSLTSATSVFKRAWLGELAIAGLTNLAVEQALDLPQAVDALREQPLHEVLNEVLTVVFQAVDPTAVTGAEAASHEISVTRLQRDLVDFARQPSTIEALNDALENLLNPAGTDFEEWLRDRYLATVAGCLAHACAATHQHGAVDDLVVDLSGWENGQAQITLTETRPGGVGVIEAIFDSFREDPRRFWRLFSAASGPSDLEVLDRELSVVVLLAAENDEVAAAFQSVRIASTNNDRSVAWSRLTRLLERHGVLMTHSVQIAIGARLLRPATSRASDQVLSSLLRRWEEIEEGVGIDLDARVFAHLASGDADVTEALREAIQLPDRDRTWYFNSILSLLWPRGRSLRSRSLMLWQPYRALPEPDRTLVAERLEAQFAGAHPVASVTETGPNPVGEDLETRGSATVSLDVGDPRGRSSLLRMLVDPLEVGVLELHPRVVGARREAARLLVHLELPELLA